MLNAVTDDRRRARAQLYQLADRLGSAAAGQGLQVAAEDDEGDQQRGRLVKRGFLAAEPGTREERVDDGDAVRRSDPGGVKQVHVRDAAPQPVPRVYEELPARAQHQRRRQREEQRLLARPGRHEAVQWRVGAEREEHDDQPQRPGDQHVDLLAAELGLSELPLAVRCVRTLALVVHFVSEAADHLLDLGGGRHRFQVFDGDGVGREVEGDIAHAGQPPHRRADHVLAVAGCHAQHQQFEPRRRHFVANLFDALGHLRDIAD